MSELNKKHTSTYELPNMLKPVFEVKLDSLLLQEHWSEKAISFPLPLSNVLHLLMVDYAPQCCSRLQ